MTAKAVTRPILETKIGRMAKKQHPAHEQPVPLLLEVCRPDDVEAKKYTIKQ